MNKLYKYQPIWSWPRSTEEFLAKQISERPILNVCSGNSYFGDVQLDMYYIPKEWFTKSQKVKADMISLPFKDDSFGAVFCDPPWNSQQKAIVSQFLKDAIRVASVVYILSPWTIGVTYAKLTHAWVRSQPGINPALLFTRYERNNGKA